MTRQSDSRISSAKSSTRSVGPMCTSARLCTWRSPQTLVEDGGRRALAPLIEPLRPV